MATNEVMHVSAFPEDVAIRSSFNLANMFSGHFEFCNIYLTQEMQNDWTMNIKQNVMSHTRITHDKFHTKNPKWPQVGHFIIIILFFYYYFFFEQTIFK